MAKQRVQVSPVMGFGSYRSTPKTSSTLDTYAGTPALEENSSLKYLAQALKVGTANLWKAGAAEEREKQQKLLSKKEILAKRVQEEIKGGKVNAVKIKEIVPEASDTTSMAIAEYMGNNEGKKYLRNEIERLKREDPDIFLDKAKLDAKMNDIRNNLSDLYSGNDFYLSGALQGFDGVIAQHTPQWTATRGAFQRDQATEYTKGKVYEILQINPKAKDAWAEIVKLDNKNKKISPLGNVEMKKAVVDSTIEYAVNNRDAEILDSIPEKFKSKGTNQKIADIKNKIKKLKSQEDKEKLILENAKLAKREKDAKTEIIKAQLNGEDITAVLNKYKDDTQFYFSLANYALQIKEQNFIDSARSKGEAQNLETAILTHASPGGSLSNIEGLTDDSSEADIIKMILNNKKIRNEDKVALIDLVPKLMEGAQLIRSADTINNYNRGIKLEVEAFQKSLLSIEDKLLGQGAATQVSNAYYGTIETKLKQYISANKKIPKSDDWEKILKAGEQKAIDRLNALKGTVSVTNIPS